LGRGGDSSYFFCDSDFVWGLLATRKEREKIGIVFVKGGGGGGKKKMCITRQSSGVILCRTDRKVGVKGGDKKFGMVELQRKRENSTHLSQRID